MKSFYSNHSKQTYFGSAEKCNNGGFTSKLDYCFITKQNFWPLENFLNSFEEFITVQSICVLHHRYRILASPDFFNRQF